MPRTADHDERKRQVAEALLRTVARKGLAKTTLVDVADELGASVGLVQRYFRSKSALLRFGIEHMYRRSEERFREVELVPPLRDLLQRLALTLLPLDEERRLELNVWLEFLPATITDPEMADLHAYATGQVVSGFEQVLTGAGKTGELIEGLEPGPEARALYALVDGLTIHQLTNPDLYDDTGAQLMLRRHIDRLFGVTETADTDETAEGADGDDGVDAKES